jgi:release factor family 2
VRAADPAPRLEHDDWEEVTMAHAAVGAPPLRAAGPDLSPVRDLVRLFAPVGYLYARTVPSDEERDVRWRALATALREQRAPESVVAVLGERFVTAEPAPTRLAAFATVDGTVRYERRLVSAGQPDVAGYVAPAPVIPLLAAEQERPPYLVVVIDRAGADLSGSRGGEAPVHTWSVAGPDDEIERNAPGGWSQPRYQRRAEDSWKHNAKRVAAEAAARIAELGAQVLVISGDVRAVQLLSDMLPSDPGLLIGHLTGSRALDGSQAGRADAVTRVLHDAAFAQTRQLLDRFRAHLDPGGLAVDGAAATLAALASGRVATLLVADPPEDAARAWFGPDVTDIYPNHRAAAASDRPVRRGRLADVAIRAAVLSDAQVRIVPADMACAPADGIGAICRYGTR